MGLPLAPLRRSAETVSRRARARLGPSLIVTSDVATHRSIASSPGKAVAPCKTCFPPGLKGSNYQTVCLAWGVECMRNRAETPPLLSLVPHGCTTTQPDIPLFMRRWAASGTGSSSSRAGLSESIPRIRSVVAEMGRSQVLCAGSTTLA